MDAGDSNPGSSARRAGALYQRTLSPVLKPLFNLAWKQILERGVPQVGTPCDLLPGTDGVSLNPHLLHYYLIPRSKDTFFSEPFYLEGLKRRRMDGCENLFTGAVVDWVRFERFS